MEKKSFNWRAFVGCVFLLPACIIVVAGLTQSLLGFSEFNEALERTGVLSVLDHPAVVIGGLVIAFGINAIPIFKLKFVREDGTLVGMVRTKNTILNLAAIALTLFLFVSILGYSIAENFQIIPR